MAFLAAKVLDIYLILAGKARGNIGCYLLSCCVLPTLWWRRATYALKIPLKFHFEIPFTHIAWNLRQECLRLSDSVNAPFLAWILFLTLSGLQQPRRCTLASRFEFSGGWLVCMLFLSTCLFIYLFIWFSSFLPYSTDVKGGELADLYWP